MGNHHYDEDDDYRTFAHKQPSKLQATIVMAEGLKDTYQAVARTWLNEPDAKCVVTLLAGGACVEVTTAKKWPRNERNELQVTSINGSPLMRDKQLTLHITTSGICEVIS